MLTYSIADRKNESIYEYLYNCIKNDIINGNLPPHTKLPSKRVFASNNGISIVTVESTYGQLMAEGYIYSKNRSGFFVSPIQSIVPKKLPYSLPMFPTEDTAESNTINLVSNHTNPNNFPFSIWAKLSKKTLNEQKHNLLVPPPAGGVMQLRCAIAKHLLDFRGIHVSPNQIIIGAGSEYLYGLIVQLLGRNLVYGLENPGSKKIKNIYQSLGVKVVPLKMDGEGVILDAKNLAIPDIIQLSPSHHFPTGVVTSISRRYGLLQWANESSSRYILEDDYDSEFRLQGMPIPSLFSMDTTDKVIYLNTFTKSLASTIRISYMILPESLLDLYYKKLGFYACTVSNFEQYTLEAFISGNYFEKHINRMRNHYKSLRDSLINKFKNSSLADVIRISEENSGLHFLLHINTQKSDLYLKEQAKNNNVIINFLSDYFNMEYESIDSNYEHTAIINYSGLDHEHIFEVVDLLSKAWSDI